MLEQDAFEAPAEPKPSAKSTQSFQKILFALACAAFISDWVFNRLFFIPISNHLSREASIFWMNVGAMPRNLGAISTLLLLLLLFWQWFKEKDFLQFRQKILLAALSGMFFPAMVIPTFFPQVMTTRHLVLYCLAASHALVIFLVGASIRKTSTALFRWAGLLLLLSSFLAVASMILLNTSQSGAVSTLTFFQTALWARHMGELFYFLFPITLGVAMLAKELPTRKIGAVFLTLSFILLIGLFLQAMNLLGPDLRIWLYKAFRVVTLLDVAPVTYGVIINFVMALCATLILLGTTQGKTIASCALLFLAAGFSPKNPGQALTLVLSAVWFCHSILSEKKQAMH